MSIRLRRVACVRIIHDQPSNTQNEVHQRRVAHLKRHGTTVGDQYRTYDVQPSARTNPGICSPRRATYVPLGAGLDRSTTLRYVEVTLSLGASGSYERAQRIRPVGRRRSRARTCRRRQRASPRSTVRSHEAGPVRPKSHGRRPEALGTQVRSDLCPRPRNLTTRTVSSPYDRSRRSSTK